MKADVRPGVRPLIESASKPRANYRDWDERYPEVVRSLVAALSPVPAFLEFEHVGSTAIPGCGGKASVDLLGLYAEGALESAKAFLLAAGFGRQTREFAQPWPESRPMLMGTYRFQNESFLIYVHVVARGSDEVRRFRTFRDRLRANPAWVKEYCALKRKILEGGVTDTDDYKVGKRPFMHRVLGADHRLQPDRGSPAA